MKTLKRLLGLHVCDHSGSFKDGERVYLICYTCGKEQSVRAKIL